MGEAVLFVSPHRSDAGRIGEALAATELKLEHAGTLAEAGQRLKLGSFRVVLTEAELPDGTWTDVMKLTCELGGYPTIVVTHRLADDEFWAEVLNSGAYDLLAQPFDEGEVRRILANACRQSPGKSSRAQPGTAPATVAV